MQKNRKLKIICFHGFGTNGDMMSRQFRHMHKLMEPFAQFYFPNGIKEISKFLVSDPQVHSFIKGAYYTWFNHRNNPEQKLFKQSLEYFIELVQKQGPFDGMIGFSQGGAFAHLIIKALKLGLIDNKKCQQLKFAIFICSVMYKFDSLQNNQSVKPIDFPTIHILSKSDSIYLLSITNTTKFFEPQIIYHGQGHKIPRLGMEEFLIIKKKIFQAINKNDKNKLIRPKL